MSFHAAEDSEDPVIRAIVFRFKSEQGRNAVVEETLRSFGDIPHSTGTLGRVLSWPQVHGYTITIDADVLKISAPRK